MDAGLDAGTVDAGFEGGLDAGLDGGPGAPDAGGRDGGPVYRGDGGLCDDLAFITACTPLRPCGSGTPALGKCDAGSFPVRDYACGPPGPGPDGGMSCGCHELPLSLPGLGDVDDERCVPQCSPSGTCSTGACTLVPAFWGNDARYGASVPLCL